MVHTSSEKYPDRNNQGFAGTLRNIQLMDIIQMCCLAGASLCIRVHKEPNSGTIYIQEGKVVHAECGAVSGINAFFTILGWKSGQFETLDAPAVAKTTIKEHCQFLLMEAARLADEQEGLNDQISPQSSQEHEKLRVLIVDDSPIMTKILTSMMVADPLIDVVGSAKNGEEALVLMKSLSPDLITMDVNMPVMDGSTALKHIMIESPCPVLIMSNLGPSSYATILNFLNLGAVDFIRKPVKHQNIVLQQQRIVDRVHIASKANLKKFRRLRPAKVHAEDILNVDESTPCQNLIVVNSGVGGYLEAVNFITALPAGSNTCVISVQSIPPPFAPTLAGYLSARSRFSVQPLTRKAPLCGGRCYIGASGQDLSLVPADRIMCLETQANHTDVTDRDTFDRFLLGASEIFQDRIVVVLLSGCELGSMEGLRKVNSSGGKIITPELDSCILPATLSQVVKQNMISEMYSAKDMKKVIKPYCI